jgi:hypothetical protein
MHIFAYISHLIDHNDILSNITYKKDYYHNKMDQLCKLYQFNKDI